jgi:hypothetical protein
MKHVIAIPELTQRLGVSDSRCRSRPYTRSAPKPKEPEPMRGIGQITVDEFIKLSTPPRIRV